MAEYDPESPVDTREMLRRLEPLGVSLTPTYLAQQLSYREGFPKPQDYELNGGRWWKWGEILAWFKSTGRLK